MARPPPAPETAAQAAGDGPSNRAPGAEHAHAQALVKAVQQALADHASAAQAGPMQAYMKSTLPFHGVPAPLRRQLVKAAALAHPPADDEALRAAVLQLWRGATHREQRYAALDLLRLPRHQKWAGLDWLPLLQECIETGPWWDHNDEISGLALGLLLQRHPVAMKSVLRRWARSPQLWFRRAAMLGQRSLGAPFFDAALLYDCILPSLAPDPLAREFFIRKGMGWALRERSGAAPDEVRAFCAEYRERLSPLTLHEALRKLGPRGRPATAHG
jgi:3-methyladenine DNA glycosylase AlkD